MAAIRNFWTVSRLRLISLTVILVITGGIAVSFITAPDQNLLLTQGDFPSFYAAAKIMREDMGTQLYSGTLQRAVQNAYWPYITHYYIYFPYPPYFASLLSPLACLPPGPAKALWDILMILCCALSLVIGAKTAPLLGRNPLGTFAFMLSFTPVLMAILGSQNIALGMLFYAVILWSFSLKKIWAEYLCGIVIGLWLFKPHYPLILICFFAAAGYYRILLGFFLVACLYYLLSAFTVAWDWPLYWSMAVRWFSEENARMGAHKMVSLLGFTRTLGSLVRLPAGITEIIGHSLSLSLGGWLAVQFWKAGKLKENRPQRVLDLTAAAGPALILLSPHTLFYDIGICIFSCARFLSLKTDRAVSGLVLMQLFMIASVGARMAVPVQPIFFAVLGSLFFILRKIRP